MKNIRWLARYLYKVKGIFIFSIILMTFETLFLSTLTIVQKYLIDEVLIANRSDVFFEIIIFIIICVIMFNLLLFVTPIISHKGVTQLNKFIIKDLITHILNLRTDVIKSEKVAMITQLFTNDIARTSNLVENISRTFQQFVAVIVSIVVFITLDPIIIILLLSFSVFYVVFTYFSSKKVKRMSKSIEQKRTDLVVHLEESISSTKEVIAFNRNKWEINIFNNYFKEYFTKVLDQGKLSNKIMFLTDPIKWGTILFVLGYGGFLVFQEKMSIGSLVIIYQFTSILLTSLQAMFNSIMNLSSSFASIERLREYIEKSNRENIGDLKISAFELNEPIKEIKFENVSLSYRDSKKTTLKDISISLPLGKKIAFVGRSGSGKSSLIKLLLNYTNPTQGNIYINKIPLAEINTSQLLNKIKIVFQEPYLFPETIRENLLMGKNIPEKTFYLMCKHLLIDDFVSDLPQKYESTIGNQGNSLSGGQKQRIAIGRSILSDPEILILDEATSSLDIESERIIQQYLDTIRKGKTTIVIAHRLSTIINSDIIYVLEDGRVCEYGTHKELIELNGEYKKLVTADLTLS